MDRIINDKNELNINGLILSGSSKFPKLLITVQKLIIKVDLYYLMVENSN